MQDPRLYLELDVPPPGSDLSFFVEQALSDSFTVDDYHCERQVKMADFISSKYLLTFSTFLAVWRM